MTYNTSRMSLKVINDQVEASHTTDIVTNGPRKLIDPSSIFGGGLMIYDRREEIGEERSDSTGAPNSSERPDPPYNFEAPTGSTSQS